MTWNHLTIGSWVSTSEGCPVRTVADECHEHVTFVFGDSGNEFELTIDRSTLVEVLRLGSEALNETAAGTQ
ncbi:hypothetical protein [Nocardia asiatica]|uniref:hypothetical protein n=1 Tax=Nocardia asiatica TaxID=209252 RepID=UPI0012F8B4BC|nr:hypothetical protein [Nocardia asiatica]